MREHAGHVRYNNALARLLDGWQYRDERYALSGQQMSPETETAVRATRLQEIERLPMDDRATALKVLNRWSAPAPERRTAPFQPTIHRLHLAR